MSKLTWAEERARSIGAEIKALRGGRTGQWLADQTASHGHAVSRTTISELENGKRRDVTLAEITVLATALGVPPLQLIFPMLPDGEVEGVPGVSCTSIQAAQWFSGEVNSDQLPGGLPALDTRRLRKSRQLAEARRQVKFNNELLRGEDEKSQPINFAASRQFEKQANELEDEMRREGWLADGRG